MAERIAVLLSSYNGEDFIEEQLESLFNQTVKIDIYVRDDGSSDNTLSILKKIEDKKKIIVYTGKNRGYCQSFFTLLSLVDSYDFYCFCDQDDIWYSNKIEVLLHSIKKMDLKKPVLVYGNYDICDKVGNILGIGPNYQETSSFTNAVMECLPTGCSMMMNKNLRDILVKNVPGVTQTHDWWVYMVACGLGEVKFVNEPLMKYRRHGKNESFATARSWKLVKFRIEKFFINDYFKVIREQNKEFYEIYRNELNSEDRSFMDKLVRGSFKDSLKLCFFHKRYRQSIAADIIIRILILIGKI